MIRVSPMRFCPKQIVPLLYSVSDPTTQKLRGVLLGTLHNLSTYGLSHDNTSYFFSKESVVQQYFTKATMLVVENSLDALVWKELDPSLGIDDRLTVEAGNQGKQIKGLETPEEMEEALQKAHEAWILRNLSFILRERLQYTLQLISNRPFFMNLKDLENQQAALAEQLKERLFSDSEEISFTLEWENITRLDAKTILHDRNEKMAERLDRFLCKKEPHFIFVAVGKEHLPGPTGLPAQLKNRGWEVQRIPT